MTAGKRIVAGSTLLAGVLFIAYGLPELATVAGVLLFASLLTIR